MNFDNSILAFLGILQAGLWEKEYTLSPFSPIDYNEIYRLADEQAVLGIVAAGIEFVKEANVPQEVALMFAGNALQLEQRNKAMNKFITDLFVKMRKEGIYTLLVKGQGVAQTYEKPLWRVCGDVDLLIETNKFANAVSFFEHISNSVSSESASCKERFHQGFIINNWVVELHGTLHGHVSKRIDRMIDEIQRDSIVRGNVRAWNNNGIDVYLPNADNDVVLVFLHILQHFYMGGIGLRQLCDWCRLLWKYRDTINQELLFERLRKMRVLSEWKAFAALVVKFLGMPVDVIPLYSYSYDKKAIKVLSVILKTGNLGHNVDRSYTTRYPTIIRRIITIMIQTKESIILASIFPLNGITSWFHFCVDGVKSAIAKDKQHFTEF